MCVCVFVRVGVCARMQAGVCADVRARIRVWVCVCVDSGHVSPDTCNLKQCLHVRAETTIGLAGAGSRDYDIMSESRSGLSPTASKIGSKIGSSSRPDYCFCPAHALAPLFWTPEGLE